MNSLGQQPEGPTVKVQARRIGNQVSEASRPYGQAAVEARIGAPPQRLFEVLDRFGNLTFAHLEGMEVQPIDGVQRGVGARRAIVFDNGLRLIEELVQSERRGEDYVLRYTIRDAPAEAPAKNYVATISLRPDGHGGTRVSWRATYDIPQDTAEQRKAAEAFKGFVENTVFRKVLSDLARHLGVDSAFTQAR